MTPLTSSTHPPASLPSRIAVIGASGNVGTALLRRLAREDAAVEAVARRVPAPGRSPHTRATWHSIDVAAPDATARLSAVLAGVDAVVHLAWAIQPSHDLTALRATNVDGTRAVLAAARAAGVAHLVHTSSVGVYAPVPDPRHKRPVDESWPASGIPTSSYSVHKAEAEALLDDAGDAPLTITRLRPGLVLQREAGGEIARYFAGPFLPARLLGSPALGALVLPLPAEFTVPVVHADDLADAFVAALAARAPGAFNIAADEPLSPTDIARGLGARGSVAAPLAAFRALAAASWRMRVQPTSEGWVDLAAGAPVMSTARATAELGWTPEVSATRALADLVAGMREGAGAGTPPLASRGRFSARRVPTG